MAGDSVDMRVDVVIPTRNEEAAIVDTIKSVPTGKWCRELGFIVVDGNSKDKTRELAESVGGGVVRGGRAHHRQAPEANLMLEEGQGQARAVAVQQQQRGRRRVRHRPGH